MNPFGEQCYIKVGRRYKPIDYWNGFPADGVWLVEHEQGRRRWLMKIGDVPDLAPVLGLEAWKDKVINAWARVREERGVSFNEQWEIMRNIVCGEEAPCED